MLDKFEQLAVIRDDILTDPNINASLVWDATKLALEDKYLYDLLIDWAKSTSEVARPLFMDEILNYTEEKIRVLNLQNDSKY